MYQIPLRFINVSDDVAICATRIVAMMSTHAHQARALTSKERQAGTLINACGNKKQETTIIMDNGAVVSSPLSIARLQTAIRKEETKEPKRKSSKRMTIYDVYDEEKDTEEELKGTDEV